MVTWSTGNHRRSEEVQAEGLLCEWFVDAPRGTHVTEEAVGLGSYGRVLTVLRPEGLPDPPRSRSVLGADSGQSGPIKTTRVPMDRLDTIK